MRLFGEIISTLGMAACAVMILLFACGTPANDPHRFRWVLARAQIDAFIKALDTFAADCGHYPSSAAGLAALSHPLDCDAWRGPYLRADVPSDPWGVPYSYSLPNGAQRPAIVSFGADRRAGGEYFATDIVSTAGVQDVPDSPLDRRIRLNIWIGFVGSVGGFIGCLWATLRLGRKPTPEPDEC